MGMFGTHGFKGVSRRKNFHFQTDKSFLGILLMQNYGLQALFQVGLFALARRL